jgi:hypothetical protein
VADRHTSRLRTVYEQVTRISVRFIDPLSTQSSGARYFSCLPWIHMVNVLDGISSSFAVNRHIARGTDDLAS